MVIYTVGFTQKRAEQFFRLLRDNGVRRLVDIRLHPDGQLSGFANKKDLPYLLRELAAGCGYVHVPALAPTDDILKTYRKDHDWENYVRRFEQLMDERDIPNALERADFNTPSCLLCSEATPEQCHRRLVAERMAARWGDVRIEHL